MMKPLLTITTVAAVWTALAIAQPAGLASASPRQTANDDAANPAHPGAADPGAPGAAVPQTAPPGAASPTTTGPATQTTPGAAERRTNQSGDGVATQQNPDALSPDDKNFVQRAAQVNLLEIELGNTAAKNSADPAIRKLGKHLAEQHTQAQQKLERLAASKGLILPDKPDAEHQKKIDELKEKKGDDFNRAFINSNISGHERAIALFESASVRTRDGELRVWMTEMLPQLKRHLDAAREAHPEAVGEKSDRTNSSQRPGSPDRPGATDRPGSSERPGSIPLPEGPMGD